MSGHGDDTGSPDVSDHRGAFGEYGGASGGFIERTFRERIVIVGVQLPGRTRDEVEESLDELELLVDTAGADVVARVEQRRDRPDPATYLGRGKVAELTAVAEATDCDTVVFDEELTPAQQRNLEKLLGRTAIDRTAVILDIFAQNATTTEGRAQVELALLRYRLPRLRGRGVAMSQQGGGIGTRMGGGETKLEVDRRRLIRRIHQLERELVTIGANRATQRKARDRQGIPLLAIVGYTNAGKSTLLNRLTDSDVLVEDRLFATLDATTRRFALPGGQGVLATDTVGFVRKLPHHLVEAFKSTLEVVAGADLLIHVVDASAEKPGEQYAAVREVLGEIGAAQVPELVVANKCDLIDAHLLGQRLGSLPDNGHQVVPVSALTGLGVEELCENIATEVNRGAALVELFVPYDRAEMLAALHRDGEVVGSDPGDAGVRVTARLSDEVRGRFADLVVAS